MAEKNFKISAGLALGDYALTANGLSLLWDSNAIASESYVDTAVAGATVNVDSLVGTGLFNDSGELAVNTNAIATKEYVDSVAQGLDVKASVKVATTEELTATIFPGGTGVANSTQIDGISLANGDRVLVKNQTTTADNGIYVVSDDGSYITLARSADADSPETDITSGAFTFVESGTTNAGKGFVANVYSQYGAINIEWSQFSEAGSLTAGSNIYLDAGSINVNVNSLVGDLDGSGLYVSNDQLAVNVNAIVGDLDANGYLRAISDEVTLPGTGDFTITSSANIILNAGAGLTSYLEAATAGNEIATHEYVTNALATVNTNAIAESLASSTLYVGDGDNLNVNVNAIVGDLDGSGLYVDGVTLAVNTNAIATSLESATLFVDSGDNLNVNVNAIVGDLDGAGLYVLNDQLAVNVNALAGSGLVSDGTSLSLDTDVVITSVSLTDDVANVTAASDVFGNGSTAEYAMGSNETIGTLPDVDVADVFLTIESVAGHTRTSKLTVVFTGGDAPTYTEYGIIESGTSLAADISIDASRNIIVSIAGASTYSAKGVYTTLA
jgi:hypothetical protein